MKSVVITSVLILLSLAGFCQQENYNKQWVQGIPRTFKTTFTPTGPVNQFWDSLNLRYFTYGHSNICTGAGELLLATDGANIYGADGALIDNGDSIITGLAFGALGGFPVQSTIILPLGDSIYYVFNTTHSDSNLFIPNAPPDLVLYHVVDMKQNGYAGKVIKKNRVAVDSARLAASHMTAVRHGNGRDWWLVKQAAVTGGSTNKTYAFLVKQDTILGPYIQSYPNTANGILFGSWSGQSAFNNAGNKYVAVDYMRYLFMTDYDRCTGLFSNPQRLVVPMSFTGDSQPSGACFSPNDSFLYVCTFGTIFQYELNNPDSATAWVKVADADTISSYFHEYVSISLGHDQKIYIGNHMNGGSTMSVINNPNAKGAACDFCPKCLRFPKINGQDLGVTIPPNMPNYALGIDPACPPNPEAVALVQAKQGILIYPNPASGSITIEYAHPGSFEIVDMTGRVVIAAALPANGGKIALSIAELSPGIYLYRYMGKDGSRAAGRMVVR